MRRVFYYRLILLLFFSSVMLLGALLFWLISDKPYPVSRLSPVRSSSLVVVDVHGRPLRQISRQAGGRAFWVNLTQIPAMVVNATLVSEDKNFFEHRGVDVRGLGRALWLNLRHARLAYGGSTITMQLARLLEPHPRTIRGKLNEMVQALRMERVASKEMILENYLNRIYYGNGTYGIEAAAHFYFGKPAVELSSNEAVFLAAIPRSPSNYDPLRQMPKLLSRRQTILQQLVKEKYLTPREANSMATAPINLASTKAHSNLALFRAPHFVDYVLTFLPSRVREDGGVVHTTLDLSLQEQLEVAAREHVSALNRLGMTQAGVVVLETHTGAVRAMVGSVSYFDSGKHGQINITTTPRHPGSALKPFTYALAMERGEAPASIAMDIADVPSAYRAYNEYAKEHGPVSYRTALASSYNLAAVHVAEDIGLENLLQRLRMAGFSTLNGPIAQYGPALTLGSGAVRLLDLASAAGFMVNNGKVIPAYGIEHATLTNGSLWALPRAQSQQIFSPEVSWLVMDILSDPLARRPGFGDDLPLDLPFRVAAKTGTSSGFADNVAFIATREFIVAAWVGDFEGKSLHAVLAMRGAAPLARAALLAAARGRPLTLPSRPKNIVEQTVCAISGKLPQPHCPHKQEYFVRGTEPKTKCSWHRLMPDGELQVIWPEEARGWQKRCFNAKGIRKLHFPSNQ